MGLLDDAIREHLDLKRRRGADPNDVERAEREALGPVRRDPFEQSSEEFEPAATGTAYEDDDAYPGDESEPAALGTEDEWDEALAEEAGPGVHPDERPEPDVPPVRAPAEEPLSDQTQVLREEDLDHEEPLAYDEPVIPRPHPAGAGAETVEYDVEQALEAEPGGELAPEAHEDAPEPRKGADEDVLEETPEFLQDTPDHDRLWFEQRPPKDFDFDG